MGLQWGLNISRPLLVRAEGDCSFGQRGSALPSRGVLLGKAESFCQKLSLAYQNILYPKALQVKYWEIKKEL
ncbi:hypothetical protein PG630_06920 [Riemerella anatipestifer]|nr:hypothetical protein [Riemerella anatipestifer]